MKIFTFLLLTLVGSQATYADIIWEENFDQYPTGTGIEGNAFQIFNFDQMVLDVSQCVLENKNDFVKTVSKRLRFQDLDGVAILESQTIELSQYTDIKLSIFIDGTDPDNEEDDFVKVSHKEDAVWVQDTLLQGSFTQQEFNWNLPSLEKTQLRIEVMNNNGNEKYNLDNIQLLGNLKDETDVEPKPPELPLKIDSLFTNFSNLVNIWLSRKPNRLPTIEVLAKGKGITNFTTDLTNRRLAVAWNNASNYQCIHIAVDTATSTVNPTEPTYSGTLIKGVSRSNSFGWTLSNKKTNSIIINALERCTPSEKTEVQSVKFQTQSIPLHLPTNTQLELSVSVTNQDTLLTTFKDSLFIEESQAFIPFSNGIATTSIRLPKEPQKQTLTLLHADSIVAAWSFQTHNPANNQKLIDWFSDTDFFIFDESNITLNGTSRSSNYFLTAVYNSQDSLEIALNLKLDFQPSAVNKLRIYLMADSANISQSSNALYIEIGEVGEDFVHFKQMINREVLNVGSSSTVIKEGINYNLNFTSTPLQTKLSIDGQLEWEGRTRREATPPFSYFALNPQYRTESRKDKYNFSDLYIGDWRKSSISQNTAEIRIDSIYTDQNSSIQLHFSHPIGEAGKIKLLDANNLEIDFSETRSENILTIKPNIRQDWDFLEVILKSISTPNKQALLSDTSILLERPQFLELLLNEFMLKTFPTVGLSNQQYIELYNASHKRLQIKDFEIHINSKNRKLKYQWLDPNKYYLIKGDLGLSSSKQNEIRLYTLSGKLIDNILIDNDFHTNDYKRNGGWSLERVSWLDHSTSRHNWKGSTHKSGGTPGQPNSILDLEATAATPKITSLIVKDSTTIQVFFNQRIDTKSLNPKLLKITDNQIDTIAYHSGALNMLLKFKQRLSTRKELTLNLSSITDLNGNHLQDSIWKFGVPESPQKQDLIINEVLYNPATNGTRFIEIYNQSSKYVNLQHLLIGNARTELRPLNNSSILSPSKYFVIAHDTEKFEALYEKIPNISQTPLPSYQEDGQVLLYYQTAINQKPSQLDSLFFRKNWHHSSLTKTKGVSLERITAQKSTNDPLNWTSNLESPHFHSSGRQNWSSQNKAQTSLDNELVIKNELFFPWQKEQLELQLAPKYIGAFVSIDIFTDQFMPVIQLQRNQQYQGVPIRWNGTNELGIPQPTGIYLLVISIKSDGGEQIIRKSCAIKNED